MKFLVKINTLWLQKMGAVEEALRVKTTGAGTSPLLVTLEQSFRTFLVFDLVMLIESQHPQIEKLDMYSQKLPHGRNYETI